ncbi:MAG: hypothetical protein J6U05_02550 [Neisseriaceae bacterium]|nr:hypothetical protein [Neisseriaceae bacterium]MBO7555169.1 hypothetical protein [Neisseriaceae bacterium]
MIIKKSNDYSRLNYFRQPEKTTVIASIAARQCVCNLLATKNGNAKMISGCLKGLIYLIDRGIATPCIARLAMTGFYFRQPENI